MQRFHFRFFIAITAFAIFLSTRASASVLADLRSDYSATSNPNTRTYGNWSYRAGSVLLSHITNWAGLPGGVSGWGPAANMPGDFLPFVTQATGPGTDSTIGADVQAGDILMHSWDAGNGDGNGLANITWTSTTAVTNVTISGNLWPSRRLPPKENDYHIILNPGTGQTVLASGLLPEDGSVSRSNPSSFSVLEPSLSPGDVVELLLTDNPSSSGDFAGLNLTISGVVPEPTTLALLVAGSSVALLRRRRRSA